MDIPLPTKRDYDAEDRRHDAEEEAQRINEHIHKSSIARHDKMSLSNLRKEEKAPLPPATRLPAPASAEINAILRRGGLVVQFAALGPDECPKAEVLKERAPRVLRRRKELRGGGSAGEVCKEDEGEEAGHCSGPSLPLGYQNRSTAQAKRRFEYLKSLRRGRTRVSSSSSSPVIPQPMKPAITQQPSSRSRGRPLPPPPSTTTVAEAEASLRAHLRARNRDNMEIDEAIAAIKREPARYKHYASRGELHPMTGGSGGDGLGGALPAVGGGAGVRAAAGRAPRPDSPELEEEATDPSLTAAFDTWAQVAVTMRAESEHAHDMLEASSLEAELYANGGDDFAIPAYEYAADSFDDETPAVPRGGSSPCVDEDGFLWV